MERACGSADNPASGSGPGGCTILFGIYLVFNMM